MIILVKHIDIFEKPEQFDEFANKLYNKLKSELKLHKIKK